MLIISIKNNNCLWVFWSANSANLFQELPVFSVKSLLRSIKPISTQPLTIKTNMFNDFISNLISWQTLFLVHSIQVNPGFNPFSIENYYKEQEWNCLHLLINPLNWLKIDVFTCSPLLSLYSFSIWTIRGSDFSSLEDTRNSLNINHF